ncbi:DUF7344 domain-containing protein [Halopenitus malekzadehii]|nr:hypothetical protein [Halopenitus malekzadehii]
MSDAIDQVLDSDHSMQLLTYLHEQRLQATSETITVPISELPEEIDNLQNEDAPGVAEGRAEVLSSMLHEEWLPAMDACTIVEYDADRREVTATPRTTLFYLVIDPPRIDEREQDEVASAVSWVVWRRDPIQWSNDTGGP